MTQFYQYRSALDAATAWTEGLGNNEVRLGTLSLTELAEHLQVGMSTIVLDDPDADLGHAGDTILAHHRFELIENDATDVHTVITFITDRKFRRGDSERPSLRVEAQRQIELSLVDLNCIPSFRTIPQTDRDAVRPRESVDDRLAWLLATTYLTNHIKDGGLIESSSVMMDKADYRGQTAANVIGDCEIAAGFGWNAWVYFDDALIGQYNLGFINANTSTAYSSSLRISNDLADIDTATAAEFETGTTFAASYDSELTLDPSNLVSGVHVPYRNSAVFRERTATSDIYGHREQSAPNANVSTKARARAMGDDYLWQHHTDAENVHTSIEVPTSKVNSIRAGHRIQVKFTHLPGYEAFRWCRVIRRTVIQEQATDRYILDLDLTPQEEPCVESVEPTFVQHNYLDSTEASAPNYSQTYSLDTPSTIGNLLVLATTSPIDQGKYVIGVDTGWNWEIVNEETTSGYHNVFWKVSLGEQDVTVRYQDHDGQVRAEFAEYAGLSNPTLTDSAMNLMVNNPGYLTLPSVSYAAGPVAVISIGFTDDGPVNFQVSEAVGTGHTDRNPISAGLHGSTEIFLGDLLQDGSSGSTPLFLGPGTGTDATGWRFLWSGGSGTNLGVLLAFEGGGCV